MLEPSGLQLSLQFHFSISNFDGHDDGGVRQIQQPGKQNAGLAEAMVVALQSGQNQISFFLSDRGGQGFRRTQRIELREIVVRDVNAAVRALGERFFDGLLHALGAHGKRSEEHTSELQSLAYLVCRLLLEKKKK